MCTTGLKIVPLGLSAANGFVEAHHRHHRRTQGMKFAIGLNCICDQLQGVAICGRPISASLDKGSILEVRRVCVKDGIKNGCSKLYGACARIAREMGYQKIITYLLASEPGISMKASGWELEDANCRYRPWKTGKRERSVVVSDLFGDHAKYPVENKQRWAKILN